VKRSLSEALAEHREAMFPKLITELLQDGYKVNFSAPGHSMFPTIMANENIMVEPIDPETVRLADIILYRTNGQLIAHRVIRIEKEINDAITVSQSPKNAQSNLFIKGDSPLYKRSAPQAQRSSSEALQFVFRGDAAAVACDEPVKASQILGKVISIERYGCSINPYSSTHKLSCFALFWMARMKRLPQIIFSIFSLYRRYKDAGMKKVGK
jgi:hypothetical protein